MSLSTDTGVRFVVFYKEDELKDLLGFPPNSVDRNKVFELFYVLCLFYGFSFVMI